MKSELVESGDVDGLDVVLKGFDLLDEVIGGDLNILNDATDQDLEHAVGNGLLLPPSLPLETVLLDGNDQLGELIKVSVLTPRLNFEDDKGLGNDEGLLGLLCGDGLSEDIVLGSLSSESVTDIVLIIIISEGVEFVLIVSFNLGSGGLLGGTSLGGGQSVFASSPVLGHVGLEFVDEGEPALSVGVSLGVGVLSIESGKSLDVNLGRCSFNESASALAESSLEIVDEGAGNKVVRLGHEGSNLGLLLFLRLSLGLSGFAVRLTLLLGSLFGVFLGLTLGDLAFGVDTGTGLLGTLATLLGVLSLGGFLGVNSVGNGTHGLGLAIGDEMDSQEVSSESWLVNEVVTSSLELDHVAFVESTDAALSNGLVLNLGVFVGDVLNFVGLFDLRLGDQVIELADLDFDSGLLISGDPSDLLGALEVLVLFVDVSVKNKVFSVGFLLGDGGIAPLHESHLLAFSEILGVVSLDDEVLAVDDDLGSDGLILGMQVSGAAFARARSVVNNELASGVFADSGVSGNDRVDEGFVSGPDLVPLHEVGVLGRSLLQHEVLQSFDGHTSAQDTLQGGETGVAPALNEALVDEPLELTLGKHSGDEVKLGEIENDILSHAEVVLNPLIESVAIAVFQGTEGVGHTFERIDDGASEIVSGVSLVLVTSLVMLFSLASVEHGVTEAPDLVLHVHLGADAESGGLSGEHLVEALHVLRYRHDAVLALDSCITLLLHLLSGSVVSVSLAVGDKFTGSFLNLLEVVGGVGDLVGGDVEGLEVSGETFDELELLGHGVRVVESEDHLALVHFGVMVVHHSGLNVTDVKVTRRLRGETSDNSALLGALEHILKLAVVHRLHGRLLSGFDHFRFDLVSGKIFLTRRHDYFNY